jgi:soluble lytic murein transglycosylase-like protein
VTDAWMNDGDGPKWIPALNAAEAARGIPTNLLARMAFQESSFRPGVISGVIPSDEGALGLMQLLPQFFKSVCVPVPFTDDDTNAQITEAAAFLVSLYGRFGDWQEAVAAYNWGAGNEHHESIIDGGYVLADMPPQTQTYVREVFGDVPIPGALIA